MTGVEHGPLRAAEVLLGCVVGIVMAWLLSQLRPLAEPEAAPTATT